MSQLTLLSGHNWPLKSLVQSALANELRLLDAGIQQTEERLKAFENKFQLTTAEFIPRFESNQIAETVELAEWVGEHRLLERLREKAEVLRGIEFAN